MSKGFFAYIRVSTVKQGVTGVSLQECHRAIQKQQHGGIVLQPDDFDLESFKELCSKTGIEFP